MPLRYSRHYAYVAQMGKTRIVEEALQDIDLLKKVTIHKDMFYHCGWARYDLAIPGSFRLTPPHERISAIKQDYRDMTAMFFKAPPTSKRSFDSFLFLKGKSIVHNKTINGKIGRQSNTGA